MTKQCQCRSQTDHISLEINTFWIFDGEGVGLCEIQTHQRRQDFTTPIKEAQYRQEHFEGGLFRMTTSGGKRPRAQA